MKRRLKAQILAYRNRSRSVSHRSRNADSWLSSAFHQKLLVKKGPDMDHEEVGRLWNENADAWTRLTRGGFDIYRDGFNTPAFFDILPDVRGQRGLDIGCGEGHNTRLVARRGARMTAVDISIRFIEFARQAESAEPLDIDYRVASAVALPFPDAAFDFATAFMSFMGIPETARVITEAYRVLKPAGFLQFSIAHPCFDTPYRKNLRS